MGMPPPKLYDLKSFIETTDSQTSEKLEVWEIGVPPKNGLYWSIVLSYLLLNKDNQFPYFLNKLTFIENEADAKRIKERLSKRNIDPGIVKRRLKNFNPFKNRYVFFNDEIIIDVFKTFKWKLNNYADKFNSNKSQEWNDELKLNAATNMLDCEIEVYFPDVNGKVVSFPVRKDEQLSTKIILFQYEDQKHGSRKDYINIFRFGMPEDYAYFLKLAALSYFLKKAKFSPEEKNHMKELMSESKSHGKCFLPTILQSPYFSLIPGIYKSPYIALKLSEAGFQTNPSETEPGKPSALLLSMTKAHTKYARILYDYATNCRYLFDRTVRNADDTILDSLKLVQDIFALDRDNIHILNIDNEVKERTLRIQSEFSRFSEYQQRIAMTIKDLRKKLGDEPSRSEILRVRKEVIERILAFYLEFFYYNLPQKVTVCDAYCNYLHCNEYYENTDSFSCLSFFDHIHMLKKIFQMKEKDLYANIESSFFLLIVSNKYFYKFQHAVRCNIQHEETECERKKNVLRFIPFLHREKLKAVMDDFLSDLKQYKESPVPQDKIKDENLRSSLSCQPEIRDELLISRIKKYLKAAIEVSFEEDGAKFCIFAIERALQVLGESIKPQSTEGCVVSCMLGSRLPSKLRRKIIDIRNDLSHYRDSLVYGRLTSERDKELFEGLKSELKKIMEAFEIVAFTQYLRLEESLMSKSLQELENHELDESVIERFLDEYKKRLHTRKISYVQYHEKCIVLSLDVINDLKEYLEENYRIKPDCKSISKLIPNIIGKLKTIEYIFLWMSKLINVNPFQSCFSDVQKYRENFENKKKIDSLRYDIECFLQAYRETIRRQFEIQNLSSFLSENTDAEYPKLQIFLDNMKKRVIYKSDIKTVIEVIEISYDEAAAARDELTEYIKLGSFSLSQKEELLLQKLIISQESLRKLRKCFKEVNKKLALKELNKKWTSKETVVNNVLKLFNETCVEDREIKTLLIKIAYQKYLPSYIYSRAKLSDQTCSEIDSILMNKVKFLLNRINDIKGILIDDDEEIKEAWKWGKSKAIKYHMRFLMRQRFLKEMPIRASLEMAFFDCLNILKREEFKDMYEKLNNLFNGINLRNVLSHGHSVLETVGGLLDEDDLPSELINKMLSLVEDSEAITKMLELLPRSGTLEKEIFEMWIENYEDEDEEISDMIKRIKKCPRWNNYLCLLPLI